MSGFNVVLGLALLTQAGEVEVIGHHLVVAEAGLWPNLHLRPDGSLLLAAFNQPSHTTKPGDVDAWHSEDGGQSWGHLATIARRPDAQSNRVNHAIGPDREGNWVALVSGYADSENRAGQRRLVQAVACRSTDGGRTWAELGPVDAGLKPLHAPIPYGDLVLGDDGSLRAAVYLPLTAEHVAPEFVSDPPTDVVEVITSRDGGRTWAGAVRMGSGINETALLNLGRGEWLAAARTVARPAPSVGQEIRQFRSGDDGKTWADEGTITEPMNHPAHLLALPDGRLVLTYGNRAAGSIDVKLSSDRGKAWGPARRLVAVGGDLGYPASVRRNDGRIVTAYYAQTSPVHKGYHAGVVIWAP